MRKLFPIAFSVLLFSLLGIVLLPAAVHAHHSWEDYHWARGSNPFVLMLGDNLSSQWDPYLGWTSYHWTRSSVFDTRVVQGRTSATDCRANTAHIQVCNAEYGKTGWLGIAQIGVKDNHILYGKVKLNDTYFAMEKYNNPAWRHLVMCQEVGHAFGLGHQDEDFGNSPLGTCMDYSSDPSPNQRPNMHDYYHLLNIYRHADFRTTAEGTSLAVDDTTITGEFNNQSEWGRLIKGTDRSADATTLASDESHIAAYERGLGEGKTVNTVVIWAQE